MRNISPPQQRYWKEMYAEMLENATETWYSAGVEQDVSASVAVEMVERVALAIFDAENGIDGDTIGTMLHGDFRIEPRDGDAGIGETMAVCRVAARAALRVMREPTAAMLQAACSKHTPGEPMPRRNEWSSGDECPHFVARRRIWRSMIDAATPPPADGEAG